MAWRAVAGRIGPWPRRAAAVACLLLALVSSIDDGRASPADDRGTPTVVAARTLPPGHELTARDVRTVRLRPALPGTLRTPRLVLGRTVAGPVARGEPLTESRFVGPGLTRNLSDGQVAVSVEIADDVRGLVTPSGRVDLMSVPAGESAAPAQRVASGVLVLAVDAGSRTLEASDSGSRLILAVAHGDALRIASVSGAGQFRVAALSP